MIEQLDTQGGNKSKELASGNGHNGQTAGKHMPTSLITPSRRPKRRSSELAVHTSRRPRNSTKGNAVCQSVRPAPPPFPGCT